MGTCEKIGTRLWLLRKGKMLRQSDVADALHISRANYAKMESGELDLRTGYCILLADFFGVTCDYILRGVEAENVDFCKTTGLSQKTIDTLVKYEDEFDRHLKDGNLAARRFLINTLIQDKEFWNEVIKAYKPIDVNDESDERVNQFHAAIAFVNVLKKVI